MSDDDNVRDEDELGENTFDASDFEEELEELDPVVAGIEDPLLADPILGAVIEEDPLDMDNEDVDDADEIDDGFSDFNDYEE